MQREREEKNQQHKLKIQASSPTTAKGYVQLDGYWPEKQKKNKKKKQKKTKKTIKTTQHANNNKTQNDEQQSGIGDQTRKWDSQTDGITCRETNRIKLWNIKQGVKIIGYKNKGKQWI